MDLIVHRNVYNKGSQKKNLIVADMSATHSDPNPRTAKTVFADNERVVFYIIIFRYAYQKIQNGLNLRLIKNNSFLQSQRQVGVFSIADFNLHRSICRKQGQSPHRYICNICKNFQQNTFFPFSEYSANFSLYKKNTIAIADRGLKRKNMYLEGFLVV